MADVRWYLDGRSGLEAFERKHIPGAMFVDLERDLVRALAPRPMVAIRCRRPRRSRPPSGVSASAPDDGVIGYDDSGGGTAGRLVWMLRVLGHPAALLDGGLRAWPEPRRVRGGHDRARLPSPAAWPSERFADHAEVATAASAGSGAVVLDARSAPRYTGEDASIDPRPGHIPGAGNVYWATNLNPRTRRFRSEAELREGYAVHGIGPETEVVCYCGSGVSACADLLALERIGVDRTRLYVPSWSGWSADPARPAETGGVHPGPSSSVAARCPIRPPLPRRTPTPSRCRPWCCATCAAIGAAGGWPASSGSRRSTAPT